MNARSQARSADPLLGTRMFGDYVVEKKLGEGGMGAVYMVKHASIDQSVALKVLHASENVELVKRFEREAKAIARLTHPNIVRVLLFGRTDDGMIYLVMEHVPGRSLRSVVDKEAPLSEIRAIYFIKQALAALAESHYLGIVHRDLKPDNLLITEYRGRPDFVKIVDFGIAMVQEPEGVEQEKLTKAGVVYGTPEYLSPEQAQAHPVDGRADLYSLGIMLYEMVTGRLPYSGNTAMAVLVQHVYDDLPDPLEIKPDLSPGIVEIIKRALTKDPQDRYQDAEEFLEALEEHELVLRAEFARTMSSHGIQKTNVWLPPASVVEEARRQTRAEQPVEAPSTVVVPSLSQGRPMPPLEAPVNKARLIIITTIVVGVLMLVFMAVIGLIVSRMGT